LWVQTSESTLGVADSREDAEIVHLLYQLKPSHKPRGYAAPKLSDPHQYSFQQGPPSDNLYYILLWIGFIMIPTARITIVMCVHPMSTSALLFMLSESRKNHTALCLIHIHQLLRHSEQELTFRVLWWNTAHNLYHLLLLIFLINISFSFSPTSTAKYPAWPLILSVDSFICVLLKIIPFP